eukprot:782312-Pleurochrysis_carterae.AAC.1
MARSSIQTIYKKKRAVVLESKDAGFAPELRKAVVPEELGAGLLPEMSALESPSSASFKLHTSFSRVVLSYSSSICSDTVKVGVAQCCLREGLDDVDAFQLEVEKCNKQKEDAGRRGFGSCHKGFVKVNSGSLTVAAEYPARFASFKVSTGVDTTRKATSGAGAVVVELVGGAPLSLADERVLRALDE